MKSTLIQSCGYDEDLIACVPQVISFAEERAVEHNENVFFSFPSARFVTSYLVNTMSCIPLRDGMLKSEFSEVIELEREEEFEIGFGSMRDAARKLLPCKRHKLRNIDPLVTDWMKPATIARGSLAMVILSQSCCRGEIGASSFVRFIKEVESATTLPVYIHGDSNGDFGYANLSFNSVKNFAAIVSLCFFYAGPNCIHSHVSGLMGIPTFVLQENPVDNRTSLKDAIAAFPSIKRTGVDSHGSQLISEASKFWRRSESSRHRPRT